MCEMLGYYAPVKPEPEETMSWGHIACDGGTRSEIVSPIFASDGRVVGVLDLDCLKEGGFEEVDREGVEKVAKLLGEGCDW